MKRLFLLPRGRGLQPGAVAGMLLATAVMAPGASGVPDAGGLLAFHTNGVAPAKRWFDGAGLGLFVHWGLASVHGRAELSWSMMKDGPYREDLALVKPRDYFALAERFRPDRYDPDRWLAAAAAAGFRYAVLTTKHHEGFALWPSAYGDFNTRTHLDGRDFVREFVDACRRHGLRVGLYYSMPDWYFHRDTMSFCWTTGGPLLDQDHRVVEALPSRPAGMAEAFQAYERGQIEELLTRYGKIDLFWPDGSGPGIIPEGPLRELQPDMILGPRMLERGDYNISAECSLPKFRPQEWWELCEMWNAGGWGYVEPGDYYPTRWMLDRFAHTRSWGGNYLINCAPDASGDMPPMYYQRMEELRTWMTTAGEAVFGTTPGPYPEQSGVPVTVRGNVWYVFLLPPDSEYRRDHTLRDVARPTEARLLRTGEPVSFDYEETKRELRLRPATSLFALGVNEPVRIVFPRPDPVAVGDSVWVRLFNGHDLTGWRQNRFAHQPRWEVKDRILVGHGGQGYLATEAEYADFELFVEVRIRDTEGARGNSGVYIRCQPHRDLAQEYPAGYEVQCDHGDENNPTGSIYNLGVPGARAPRSGAKDNQWFTLRILAQGDQLRTWVNGEPGADCRLPPGGHAKGYILLQQHHRSGIVEFRQVRIRPL